MEMTALGRITRSLHGLRRKIRLRDILDGACRIAGALLAAAVLLSILEMLFWMPPSWKITLWISAGAVFLTALFLLILRPLFSLLFRKQDPSDDRLAARVGAFFPGIRDRLLNALQVARSAADPADGTSPELAEAAAAAAWKAVEGLDFTVASGAGPARRGLRFPAAAAAAGLAVFLLFPRGLPEAGTRLMHPGTRYAKPLPFGAVIRPGSVRVVEGEALVLFVEGRPLPQGRVQLIIRDSRNERTVNLSRPFRHRIPAVTAEFDYAFRLAGFRSGWYEVRLLRRPELKSLEVKVTPPRYTGAGPVALEKNVGHVEALRSSGITLTVKSSKPIRNATLVFGSGKRLPMECSGDKASGRFTLTAEDRYWIELEDSLGLGNRHPVRYTLRVLEDRPPEAAVLFPGPSAEMDASGRQALALEGTDDYGVTEGRIGYFIETPDRPEAADTVFIDLPVPGRPPLRLSLDTLWNLESLQMFPEDRVRYFFEVWDNDAISGPKRGRSPLHAIRFPSVMEIIQKTEQEQEYQLNAVETIAEDRRAFQEEIRALSDLMKTGQEPTWSRKENLSRGVERQMRQEDEIRELQERLETLEAAVESDERMGLEALEKVRELRKLYGEIDSPELRENLARLSEALKQSDPEQLRREAERLQISQEDVLKALDRTISLMRRMKTQMQVEGLIRRVDDMARRQEKLNDSFRESAGREAAIGEERKLARESEALGRDADSLSDSGAGHPEFPDSAFSGFLSDWENRDFPDQFESMTAKLRAGDPSEAGRMGRETVRSLDAMKEQLERVRDMLENKNGTLEALAASSGRLLELSGRQESLMTETNAGTRAVQEAAERQEALRSNLEAETDSLFRMSKQNFAVTPRIAEALREAMSGMQQSLRRLENRDLSGSAAGQARAMGDLNRAVMEIQSAAEQLRASGSGAGMQRFFDQMGGMSASQLALNQRLAEMLRPGLGEELSLEARAGMPRLAAEQDALRRRLEDLVRQFEGRGRRPADMSGILEDMKRTVEELIRGTADGETQERQRRILSRMLESQRSLREQDEGRGRKARSGKNVVRSGPDAGPARPSDTQLLLKRRLEEMSEEGFTPEYRSWIRDYFERLAREKR
ncbi:MAG: DUF4175 family protein [bacterium]|nr:DUF4175 family protein [bacterium]